jgi:transposase
MRPAGTPAEPERRRWRAVELPAQGHSLGEVARRVGVDRRSVRRSKPAYRKKGHAAIAGRPARGRPPKLSASLTRRLKRALLCGAQAAGFPSDLWTCPRVAQLIARRFHVRYRVDHMGRLLHALGWSLQKPARRAIKRNEEVIRGWVEQTWPALNKNHTG